MMRLSNRFSLLLILLGVLAVSLHAQEPTAQIVYAEDEYSLVVIDRSGDRREANIGDNVRVGETLRTGSGAAELRLNPNGTIIKLARNTAFKVDALDGLEGKASNDFQLLGGKLRTVAARSTGRERYSIRTRRTVAGVRGTDFSLEVEEGKADTLYVASGKVEYARVGVGNVTERIMVGAGQFADAFADIFQAMPAPAAIVDRFADLAFKSLDPANVDQSAPVIEDESVPEEPAADETVAPDTDVETPETDGNDGESPTVTPAGDVNAADIISTDDMAGPGAASAEASDRPTAPAKESKFMAWMSDVMGFEVGAISINDETWSKVVLQPTFELGKAKISLYLPIIYTNNLFDSSSWYQPAGNNEWSFGFDYWETDPLAGAIDFAKDLALKIRYVEYGNRWVDPFYFNIGNLSTMTIGHGAIMRNFANDSDFPSIRRIGLNTGFEADKWGMEFVVNDLAQPDIFGTRVKFLNLFGVSAITDINPARDLEETERIEQGDPIFLATSLDLDIPIMKTELLHLRAFTDFAFMLPYTRTGISGGPAAGMQWAAVYDETAPEFLDRLRNYGVSAGFLGNILFVDWRLEYRLFRGTFRPAFFDASYERVRGSYVYDMAALLSSGSENQVTVNGVYGEAGFNLLKNKLQVTAGYLLPWTFDSTIPLETVMANDHIVAKLIVAKGLFPAFNIHGSISYERTGFAEVFMSKAANVSLFDGNTVFRGELVYPITPGMDLAAIFSTAAMRDSTGNLILDAQGNTQIEPTITFETRISF